MAPRTVVETIKITDVSVNAISSPLVAQSPPLSQVPALDPKAEEGPSRHVANSLRNTQDSTASNIITDMEYDTTFENLQSRPSLTQDPRPEKSKSPVHIAQADPIQSDTALSGVVRTSSGKRVSHADRSIIESSEIISPNEQRRPVRAAKASALEALMHKREGRISLLSSNPPPLQPQLDRSSTSRPLTLRHSLPSSDDGPRILKQRPGKSQARASDSIVQSFQKTDEEGEVVVLGSHAPNLPVGPEGVGDNLKWSLSDQAKENDGNTEAAYLDKSAPKQKATVFDQHSHPDREEDLESLPADHRSLQDREPHTPVEHGVSPRSPVLHPVESEQARQQASQYLTLDYPDVPETSAWDSLPRSPTVPVITRDSGKSLTQAEDSILRPNTQRSPLGAAGEIKSNSDDITNLTNLTPGFAPVLAIDISDDDSSSLTEETAAPGIPKDQKPGSEQPKALTRRGDLLSAAIPFSLSSKSIKQADSIPKTVSSARPTSIRNQKFSIIRFSRNGPLNQGLSPTEKFKSSKTPDTIERINANSQLSPVRSITSAVRSDGGLQIGGSKTRGNIAGHVEDALSGLLRRSLRPIPKDLSALDIPMATSAQDSETQQASMSEQINKEGPRMNQTAALIRVASQSSARTKSQVTMPPPGRKTPERVQLDSIGTPPPEDAMAIPESTSHGSIKRSTRKRSMSDADSDEQRRKNLRPSKFEKENTRLDNAASSDTSNHKPRKRSRTVDLRGSPVAPGVEILEEMTALEAFTLKSRSSRQRHSHLRVMSDAEGHGYLNESCTPSTVVSTQHLNTTIQRRLLPPTSRSSNRHRKAAQSELLSEASSDSKTTDESDPFQPSRIRAIHDKQLNLQTRSSFKSIAASSFRRNMERYLNRPPSEPSHTPNGAHADSEAIHRSQKICQAASSSSNSLTSRSSNSRTIDLTMWRASLDPSHAKYFDRLVRQAQRTTERLIDHERAARVSATARVGEKLDNLRTHERERQTHLQGVLSDCIDVLRGGGPESDAAIGGQQQARRGLISLRERVDRELEAMAVAVAEPS